MSRGCDPGLEERDVKFSYSRKVDQSILPNECNACSDILLLLCLMMFSTTT
jgi:hypothetical protein